MGQAGGGSRRQSEPITIASQLRVPRLVISVVLFYRGTMLSWRFLPHLPWWMPSINVVLLSSALLLFGERVYATLYLHRPIPLLRRSPSQYYSLSFSRLRVCFSNLFSCLALSHHLYADYMLYIYIYLYIYEKSLPPRVGFCVLLLHLLWRDGSLRYWPNCCTKDEFFFSSRWFIIFIVSWVTCPVHREREKEKREEKYKRDSITHAVVFRHLYVLFVD